MGGCRPTSALSVPRAQDLPKLLGGQPPSSDIQQRSYQDPDHMFQEAICGDHKVDTIPCSNEVGFVDVTDRVSFAAIRRPEGTEIVLANEDGRGLADGGYLQWLMNMKKPMSFKSRGMRGIQDSVSISFSLCRPSRVKVFGSFLNTSDHDVGREQAVEGPLPFIGGEIFSRPKVRHLPQGMHPGISPACAGDGRVLP